MIRPWSLMLRCLLMAGPVGAAGLLYGAATLSVGPAAVAVPAAARPPADAPRQAAAPAPFLMAAAASFTDLTERPIFSPARRPFVAEAPPPPPPSAAAPPPNLDVAIKAIVIAQGERMALVSRGGQKRAELLSEREQIDGWTVSAITRDAVLFRLGTRELHLSPAPPLPGAVVWSGSEELGDSP